MERESRFVQRYEVAPGQNCLHLLCRKAQTNSTVGNKACLLIKTLEDLHSVNYIKYVAGCQKRWITKAAV